MTSDEALAIMRPDVPGRLDAEAFGALERLLADQVDEPDAERAEAVLDRLADAES
jgi:HD-GYP domain-containing protein (c-di-GMP phosphodiesterase class II)